MQVWGLGHQVPGSGAGAGNLPSVIDSVIHSGGGWQASSIQSSIQSSTLSSTQTSGIRHRLSHPSSVIDPAIDPAIDNSQL